MALAALGVILSILKVIGIVVLCIIAIIIILLLIVLFVPFRWKAQGTASADNKDLHADGKWLFGVITFNARYEDGGFPYAVKLFGHKIFPKGDD